MSPLDLGIERSQGSSVGIHFPPAALGMGVRHLILRKEQLRISSHCVRLLRLVAICDLIVLF